jgi:hypothetical protein
MFMVIRLIVLVKPPQFLNKLIFYFLLFLRMKVRYKSVFIYNRFMRP